VADWHSLADYPADLVVWRLELRKNLIACICGEEGSLKLTMTFTLEAKIRYGQRIDTACIF
jgi:hypothetical protein